MLNLVVFIFLFSAHTNSKPNKLPLSFAMLCWDTPGISNKDLFVFFTGLFMFYLTCVDLEVEKKDSCNLIIGVCFNKMEICKIYISFSFQLEIDLDSLRSASLFVIIHVSMINHILKGRKNFHISNYSYKCSCLVF